jgi:signal transduction histidine kinase
VAVGLFVAVGFLGVKRVQSHRTEAMLRAESAEYQAQAAEYKAKSAETEMLRLQADAERRRREEQQEYFRQLIAAQEAERSRIAVELHDQLGQDLVFIRNRMLVAAEAAGGAGHLDDAVQAAAGMLENVRRLARNLRPFQLDRYGLTDALNAMIERIGAGCTTNFTAEIDPLDGVFEKGQEIHVYRIVQECINNILRHAGASEALVRVVHGEELVELVIEDDGCGFSGGEPSFGFGLHGIRHRVDILGGSIRLQTPERGGTRILVTLPITSAGDVKLQEENDNGNSVG